MGQAEISILGTLPAFVIGSTKTQNNHTSLNLQYKPLITIGKRLVCLKKLKTHYF